MLNNDFLKKVALSFVRAFAGTLIVLLPGLLVAPAYHFDKAAMIAVLVGAVTAGLRAVQQLLES